MIFVRKAYVVEHSVRLSAGTLLLRADLADECTAVLGRFIYSDKENLDADKSEDLWPLESISFSIIYF